MISVAEDAKQLLSAIESVKTVKIGIEPNISPNDYPIIRIVPVDTQPDNSNSYREKITFDIFVGIVDKDFKDGYEAIYTTIEAIESQIKQALDSSDSAAYFWQSSKHDEDRLQNVKALAMRYKAIG